MSDRRLSWRRLPWLCLVWICVALGAAGIVLPLVPTTPFLLVAMWAAPKASPQVARWLISHPRFGPIIQAWRRERAVPLSAKLTALVLMALSWGILWATQTRPLILIFMALLFIAIATFLVTRPTPTR